MLLQATHLCANKNISTHSLLVFQTQLLLQVTLQSPLLAPTACSAEQ